MRKRKLYKKRYPRKKKTVKRSYYKFTEALIAIQLRKYIIQGNKRNTREKSMKQKLPQTHQMDVLGNHKWMQKNYFCQNLAKLSFRNHTNTKLNER